MPASIRPSELRDRFVADPMRVYLLDVRQPAEHAFASIAGDHLIPLDELPRRAQEIDLAPGQTLVAYDGTRVVGSATIERTDRVADRQPT